LNGDGWELIESIGGRALPGLAVEKDEPQTVNAVYRHDAGRCQKDDRDEQKNLIFHDGSVGFRDSV
jgi:hypothetical protein